MGLDTVKPQPPPVKGKDSVTEAVIGDLLKRREGGLKKYGVELESHNGRNALVDAYQEMTDAVLYLRQQLMEDDDKKVVRDAALEALKQIVSCLVFIQRQGSRVDGQWLVRSALANADMLQNFLETP